MAGALVPVAALALVHFLWEGLLIGVLAALALRGTRDPRTHHLICIVALVACLAAPVITAAVVAAGLTQTLPGAAGALGASLPAAAVEILHRPVAPHWPDGMHLAVIVWLAGVLLLSGYYLLQWLGVTRLRRSAFALTQQPGLAAAARRLLGRWQACARVTVMASEACLSPLVVGMWRPVILFPAALLARMSVRDFELILLHEVAHILRRDAWLNALQVVVEILLFYHPVVHWLSRRARLYRECACDDFAVQASGSAYAYAQALTRLTFPHTAPLALGAAGGELVARLRHLAGDPPERTAVPRSPAPLLLLAATAAALVLLQAPVPQAMPGEPMLSAVRQGAPPADTPALDALFRIPVEAPPDTAAAGGQAPAVAAAAAHPEVNPDSPAEQGRRVHETPRTPALSPALTAAQPGTPPAAVPPAPSPAGAAAIAADRPQPAAVETAAAPSAPLLTATYDPAPAYPLQARLAGVQGTVEVVVRIAADGHTEGLSILKATPQGVFEGAVRRALMHWRYQVADGAAHMASYQISFTLEGVSTRNEAICATATASRTCAAQ